MSVSLKRAALCGALVCLAAILLAACSLETSRPGQVLESAQPAASPTLALTLTSPPAAPTQTQPFIPTVSPTLAPASPTPQPVRFAVIGDYGEGSQGEQEVASLIKSWNPDFIITVGDNNYPSGAAATIDEHIGQYYSDFIFPYTGAYGPGAQQNRFFPSLGNHDWGTLKAQAYFDYFTLPGNERYYDFTWGPLHFFAVDSDSREPDGVSRVSVQAQWLQNALAGSTSAWNVVYFHHPPYSSGTHGPVTWMRWPFAEWGVDVLLAGHDHTYERLLVDGIPLIINGVGGGPIYAFLGLEAGSQVRYNDDYGAMLVTADEAQMFFQFINRQGTVIDTFQLSK